MIDQRWVLWLIGWGASALLLAVLYLWQRRTRDATAVDAGWGASLALCALLYLLLAPGCLVQRLAIALPVAIENIRIASLVRNRLGKGEDGRYQELRRRWREKGREQRTFAIFYQAQALLAALLSVPALLASFNRDGSLAVVQWIGIGLWIVAASLEATADRQLAAFRRDPANKGGVMASRPLELLPPPELLLPDAHLGRVRAHRRHGAVRLDRVLRAGAHPLLRSLHHRRAAGGRVIAPFPRRRLPRVPGAHVRLRPVAAEALVDRDLALEEHRQTSSCCRPARRRRVARRSATGRCRRASLRAPCGAVVTPGRAAGCIRARCALPSCRSPRPRRAGRGSRSSRRPSCPSR